jgi:hypothetical protein
VDAALKLVALACVACSVPPLSLDGKLCPCADGYTCDTATNHCRANVDAPIKDAPGATCLGPAGSGQLTGDNFGAWTNHTTMWSTAGSSFVQNDPNDMLAYAIAPASPADTVTRYRIVAGMTGTAGGTGMGVAFRYQGGRAMYDCLWLPGVSSGVLLIQRTNNGGSAMTLRQSPPTPSSGTTAHYTMELLADGSTLHCCIDGSNVSVTTTDTMYMTGPPGLVTDQMAATFDSFTVYSN